MKKPKTQKEVNKENRGLRVKLTGYTVKLNEMLAVIAKDVEKHKGYSNAEMLDDSWVTVRDARDKIRAAIDETSIGLG